MPTFELWEIERGKLPDLMVVSVESDDRKRALDEIHHYALMYGQDGSVEIREVGDDG